jgi:hypothetical protein|tara:strand:- start:3314 stop:3868 length:555 start_codon:yes stop_codon:yes gene_type:complete
MSESPISNRPIKAEKASQGNYISPFVSNGDHFRSSNRTSYDLTNPQPAGGPIHAPDQNHNHQYTPNNTYLDNFGEIRSNNSGFGVVGNGGNYATVLDNSIFEKTDLDVENPLPLGGTNTTNIPDIPGGFYITTKTSNLSGLNPFPGGTLYNDDGTPYTVQVQQYNSERKYLSTIQNTQIPLNEL